MNKYTVVDNKNRYNKIRTQNDFLKYLKYYFPELVAVLGIHPPHATCKAGEWMTEPKMTSAGGSHEYAGEPVRYHISKIGSVGHIMHVDVSLEITVAEVVQYYAIR